MEKCRLSAGSATLGEKDLVKWRGQTKPEGLRYSCDGGGEEGGYIQVLGYLMGFEFFLNSVVESQCGCFRGRHLHFLMAFGSSGRVAWSMRPAGGILKWSRW